MKCQVSAINTTIVLNNDGGEAFQIHAFKFNQQNVSLLLPINFLLIIIFFNFIYLKI